MTNPSVAAIIIGIDGWQQYTLPLVESLRLHEPNCNVVVIDNASTEPYPQDVARWARIERTPRLCYSRAINTGKSWLDSENVNADWYIVLSNDVLCTGPFSHLLEQYNNVNAIIGPQLWQINIERVGPVDYVVGWCVAISRRGWEEIGPWDAGMQISSYEDCDYSHRARKAGYSLVEDLPFVHLDQKQRFYLVPNYWDSEYHNRARFIEKHAKVTA